MEPRRDDRQAVTASLRRLGLQNAVVAALDRKDFGQVEELLGTEDGRSATTMVFKRGGDDAIAQLPERLRGRIRQLMN